MSHNEKKNLSTTIGFKLPKNLKEEFIKCCKQDGRMISFVLNQAVKKFINDTNNKNITKTK